MSFLPDQHGLSRFPYQENLVIEDKQVFYKDVIKKLGVFLTEERILKIEEIVQERTYSIVPVLDSIYDLGNLNAVIRSAENLGYQALHIIKSEKNKQSQRSISSVTLGCHKWVDTFYYNSRLECLNKLKSQGYQIWATSLNEKAVALQDLDFSKPTAMVFGNEKEGVSHEILEEASGTFYIPTSGFSQSFNISVATAICLHHAYLERFKLWGRLGDLNLKQQEILKSIFYSKSVNNYEMILSHLGLFRPL